MREHPSHASIEPASRAHAEVTRLLRSEIQILADQGEQDRAEIARLRSLVEMYSQIIDSEALLADFLRSALADALEPEEALRAWEEARRG